MVHYGITLHVETQFSILLTIARFLLVPANSRGMKLFVDLDGYPNPGECFGSQSPVIVIINGKEVIVIKLSVCYETRTEILRKDVTKI